MSDSKEIKKKGRGVSNATQAVNQLRFHEKDAAPNGLFIAELTDVKVDWSTNADAKVFAGIRVPRLTFEFTSPHPKAAEKRHAYYTLFPVESNVNTMEGGTEEWKVNQVLNGIKHLLDVFYLKGRLMTADEENMLTLGFCDSDEEGNYIPIDPQDVADAYGTLFTNVANIFNGITLAKEGETPKPIFKDKDGKPIQCWLKLIRAKRIKGDWKNVTNGELAFDPFIGNGFVELKNGNNQPTILRVDVSKESIRPQDVKKSPNMPGLGGVMVDNGMMGSGMPSDMNAYNAAADEMPF